jgi:hypothetical protein
MQSASRISVTGAANCPPLLTGIPLLSATEESFTKFRRRFYFLWQSPPQSVLEPTKSPAFPLAEADINRIQT